MHGKATTLGGINTTFVPDAVEGTVEKYQKGKLYCRICGSSATHVYGSFPWLSIVYYWQPEMVSNDAM
jgi:hypothetical protein